MKRSLKEDGRTHKPFKKMIFVDKKMGRQAVVERRKTQREMRQKSRVGGISQSLDRGNKILDITIYNASL
jgi:hypothetical protein